jgi:hypothetical protein
MISVVMLIIVVMGVIMLSIMVPFCAMCHFAECCYSECHLYNVLFCRVFYGELHHGDCLCSMYQIAE